MGNKFARVVPEMFQGNAENADGTFSSAKSPLTKLKVMYVRLASLTYCELCCLIHTLCLLAAWTSTRSRS